MSEEQTIQLSLTLKDNYAFTVDFGDAIPSMIIDEGPPLGHHEGPNPSRVLASALAGCLGASLLFCLRKGRVDVRDMRTDVRITNGRNEKGRLRVKNVTVHIVPTVPADQHERMARCLEIFEDFCVVTAAVRDGVDIDVTVDPQAA